MNLLQLEDVLVDGLMLPVMCILVKVELHWSRYYWRGCDRRPTLTIQSNSTETRALEIWLIDNLILQYSINDGE